METAEAMYKTGRYIYVVFMAQQSIEKAVKALIEAKGKVIPFEHNLRGFLILLRVSRVCLMIGGQR